MTRLRRHEILIHACAHTCTLVLVHTHAHKMKYYLGIKGRNLPFLTSWMELEGIMLSEKVRSRLVNSDFTFMWTMKNRQNWNRTLEISLLEWSHQRSIVEQLGENPNGRGLWVPWWLVCCGNIQLKRCEPKPRNHSLL